MKQLIGFVLAVAFIGLVAVCSAILLTKVLGEQSANPGMTNGQVEASVLDCMNRRGVPEIKRGTMDLVVEVVCWGGE